MKLTDLPKRQELRLGLVRHSASADSDRIHSELVGDGIEVTSVEGPWTGSDWSDLSRLDGVVVDAGSDVDFMMNAVDALQRGGWSIPIVVVETLPHVVLPNDFPKQERVFSIQRSFCNAKNVRTFVMAGINQEHSAPQVDLDRMRLEFEANHDILTGLFNRRGLERAIETLRANEKETGPCCVALIDCDDFKAINTRHGHSVGDQALAAISSKLAIVARSSDQLARVGGDEFLLILPGVTNSEGHAVAERMRRSVEQAGLTDDGSPVDLSVSVGLVEFATIPPSIEVCLKSTRGVLEASKARGKNRVVSEGCASSGGSGHHDPRLAFGLISGRWLTSLVQPIVNLETRTVFGYEALVRGPRGPLHDPSAIFRLARDQGLQAEADIAALKTALKRAPVSPDEVLFVNLFPSTLARYAGCEIAEILRKRPGRVCVELSEQEEIRDPHALQKPLSMLRDIGALIAMDDVGAGRTSVQSIACIKPDIIKLDRGALLKTESDASLRRVYQSLIRMGQSVGAEIVAEGIETLNQLEIVRDLGVEYGQGYFFGRPQAGTVEFLSWQDATIWPMPKSSAKAALGPVAATDSTRGIESPRRAAAGQ